MNERYRSTEPMVLTPDTIKAITGFELEGGFPDFTNNAELSTDLSAAMQALTTIHGEGNALISFYVGEDNEIQLGMFVKKSPGQDLIEAMRQSLIARGITDPEEQKPILQRLYQDSEDPRPRQR